MGHEESRECGHYWTFYGPIATCPLSLSAVDRDRTICTGKEGLSPSCGSDGEQTEGVLSVSEAQKVGEGKF